MKILVGMYLYCVMTVPLEVKDKVYYEEMYATCKVDIVNTPSVPSQAPTFVYVDCTEAIGWIVKGQKRKPIMTYWSRYERGECHVDKYHWL